MALLAVILTGTHALYSATTATPIETLLAGEPTFIVEPEGPPTGTPVSNSDTGECWMFKVDIDRWPSSQSFPSLNDFDEALKIKRRLSEKTPEEKAFIKATLNSPTGTPRYNLLACQIQIKQMSGFHH